VCHPIYIYSEEVKCCYWPKKGINIARRCVNGYSITAAPAKSVTHVMLWWCGYQLQSNGGKYATWPVAWVTGSMTLSVRGYELRPEQSDPSGTPGCFRRKLGLLLMDDVLEQVLKPQSCEFGLLVGHTQCTMRRVLRLYSSLSWLATV